MMDVEQLEEWRAADALFDQWLDQAEPERDAWLAAQQMPAAVRRRVLQLVRAHERTGNALDSAAGDLAGRSLGDWTLESELGRGGMAVVYLARREQGMASQRAAVKVLTLAALGAGGRERFQREAGILARLGHPNITRLIDSGVADDGTCWLAMPLVEGERIDHWCQARGLDARAIVQLYLQVCAAVAYAHRNLVIHRDLKPSNVLVDTDGNVHLLDFGIGQFADVPGEPTRTQWRALTPGYAAPEQLRGELPTTAIDVYGLGALLHRLLTGRTPGSPAGIGGTTRPSLLVRGAEDAYHRHYVPLKNDLDLVLLKALAEEPERRYPSVEAMALDLRRWLEGELVQAEKPRLGYRVRKFVARNKAGVAASVLVAASLAAGVGTTLWQAGEARREAGNAQVQAQRAILVRDFLARVFASTEPAAGGVPDALELLDEGARRARTEVLGSDPLAAADILMLTGGARADLGEYVQAREDLEEANALLRGAPAYAERARIHRHLSQLARQHGDGEGAQREAHAAVRMGDLALAQSGDPEPLLSSRVTLGMSLFASDPAAAAATFESVLAALPAYDLEETELHITVLDGLSAALAATAPDQTQRLVEIAEEQIRVSRLVDGTESGHYASTLADQVPTFSRAGDHARARQLALEAVSIADRAYTKPHTNKAAAHCQLAANLHWGGEYARAVQHYAVANGINSELGLSDLHVQACFMFGAYARATQGDYHAALDELERSWAILGDHDYRDTPTGYASCGTQASVQLRAGEIESAARTLAGCVPAEGTTLPLMYTQARAELHFARGELDDAARVAREARINRPPEAEDRYWMRPWMLSLLLAREMGDVETASELAAVLQEFAHVEPLSQCLAQPSEATCLTLP